MSLTATDKGSGTPRPLTPAGSHVARCFSLVDLGTQHESYQGKPKISGKVRVSWELPYEKAIFNEEKGEQPFSISKEYTSSLSEKANLRHDLESWRGRPFTEKELKGFDLTNVVGKTCMVTVAHQKSADGKKTYDKVISVTSLPKDPATGKPMVCPPQINPSVIYDIEDGENVVFKAMPEWIQKKIKESEEFRAAGKSEAADEHGEDEADDVAF